MGRSNIARTVYAYQTQGANDTAQAQLDQAQSANASAAGGIGALTSIIGGASSLTGNWAKFNQISAFSPNLNLTPGGVGSTGLG